MMAGQDLIFDSLGINIAERREIKLDEKWVCYNLNHNNPTKEVPIILIERGPKNITEVKRRTSGFDACVILFSEKNTLYLKSLDKNHVAVLDSDQEYERISSVISSHGMADATNQVGVLRAIQRIIESIPSTAGDFDNRGLFSTHYLRNRLFGDSRVDLDTGVERIRPLVGGNPNEILEALGWDMSADSYYGGRVSVTVTPQDDFGIRASNTDVVPSYAAVATLRDSQWAILTNGRRWRLYSGKISASSTNYFEITLDVDRENTLRYLVAIFGASAYEEIGGRTDIEMFLKESAERGRKLEDDLSCRIMQPNGLFINLVKGVLDHSLKSIYTIENLEDAKQTSLKIMYRVWFLAYAESRNLLPVHDDRYKPISLRTIRTSLDSYEEGSGQGVECWDALLKLFDGVRNGSAEHNLPQYDGGLFRQTPSIDEIPIKNKFIVNALRDLLEKDGVAIDYADLGVRHLGNIFETLMEFSVKQAEKDIMLIEDGDGVREVKTRQESTYSYKKNDLYLASKAGIITRKKTASFYTPNEMVEFLVRRGLEPIFAEREKLIGNDLRRYKKDRSDRNLKTCMNRLLDIQVLDPAMGSGHFLVEALNKITTWATNILKKHPDHPLLAEIESDRNTVLAKQKEKGIVIEDDLLTHDVLLKRRVMKRCIFGVDLNPMAVELTKLSLWLDSFAIGVPLTYMDHHIKNGDSTIGMWMKNKDENITNQTLDTWMQDAHNIGNILHDVSIPADITIADSRRTKQNHDEYEIKIKPYKKMLDVLAATHIDENIAKNSPQDLTIIADMYRSRKKSIADDRHKKIIKQSMDLSKKLHFFHWELEIMDAFTDERSGFDLVVTNPPWDKIRPNKNEFFRQFVPTYKNESTERKKEIHEKYSAEFDAYEKTIIEKRTFYKNRGGIGENTDYEIYRLFIERIIEMLSPRGVLSILVPSALIGSRGATAIRNHILEHKILSLYEFENKNRIFPIDTRTKFVLLTVQNIKSNDDFPTAFYLQNLDDLNNINEKSFRMSKNDVQLLSPELSIICELRERKDLDMFVHLFSNHSRLKDMEGWFVDLGRELNIGEEKDRKLLLKNRPGGGGLASIGIKEFSPTYVEFFQT